MPAPGIFMHTSTRQQKLTDDGAANRESLPCPITYGHPEVRDEKTDRKTPVQQSDKNDSVIYCG